MIVKLVPYSSGSNQVTVTMSEAEATQLLCNVHSLVDVVGAPAVDFRADSPHPEVRLMHALARVLINR